MRHKHADAIHAWADGLAVQLRINVKGTWKPWRDVPATINPQWSDDVQYRVKPETKITKYRNYVTEDGRIGVVVKGEDPPDDMSMWLDDWLELESEV